LTPPSDRDRIDRELAAFLDDSRRRDAANPHLRPLHDRAAGFVLRGGKRLRPRLALAGYRILAGRPDPPRPAWLAAASLELFHAFMLVHDDLIDDSPLRRDLPALHEALRLDDDAGRPGRAAHLALIAGDLLCALGHRLLARSGLEDAALGRAQRLVADVLIETGAGEALDVLYGDLPPGRLSESQVLDAYLRKTARYSVSGPLALGATLAGAPAATLAALRRFGDLLGLGYQIQNDLEALAQDPGLGPIPDLDAGKRTWLLWTAHRRLPPAGRAALLDALDGPPGPPRRARLFALIHDSGAPEAARARLDALRADAADALGDPSLTVAQRQAFLALVGLFAPATPPPADVPEALFLAPVPELIEKASA
jgi:geranylgeranyl diphosphate synthase type I